MALDLKIKRYYHKNYMIGRIHEVVELNRLYNSQKAELVAVYGRRRVGKTYLVDEVFKNKITFRHAGLSPVDGAQGRKMMNFIMCRRVLTHPLPLQNCPDLLAKRSLPISRRAVNSLFPGR